MSQIRIQPWNKGSLGVWIEFKLDGADRYLHKSGYATKSFSKEAKTKSKKKQQFGDFAKMLVGAQDVNTGDLLSCPDQRFELHDLEHGGEAALLEGKQALRIVVAYHDKPLNTGRDRWCVGKLPFEVMELDAQPQPMLLPLCKGGEDVARLECCVRFFTEVF